MPTTSVRFHAKDPNGKSHTTQLSLSKYTAEEADMIGQAWKESIRTGKEFVKPELQKKERPVVFHFEHKSFLECVKLSPDGSGTSFLLLGATKSGKSTAMCYIYEKMFKKHITFLMTHSTQAQIYKPLKNTIISPGYFKQLIDEPMKINKETKNNYDFCFVFDDLALDGKNSMQMSKLLTIGRNSSCSVIYSGQKLSMLNATGRANINYVCCFKQNTDAAIIDTVKTYMRSYFPAGMRLNDMVKMYKEMTQDHKFFCIDTINDEVHLCKINTDA